jgi:hypothetical protein
LPLVSSIRSLAVNLTEQSTFERLHAALLSKVTVYNSSRQLGKICGYAAILFAVFL